MFFLVINLEPVNFTTNLKKYPKKLGIIDFTRGFAINLLSIKINVTSLIISENFPIQPNEN